MIEFAFTYQTISEESAQMGDFEDHGFILPGHWQYSMNDDKIRDDILKNRQDYVVMWPEYRLHEILNFARDLGICYDCNNWLESVDPSIDYSTGIETYYAFHPKVTQSTYNRIKRVLKIK